MIAVYVATPSLFTPALQWIWFAGMVALAAGVALERYARVSGRAAAKRAIPGVVVAVLLILLAIGKQQGVFHADAYTPYCEGGWYYTNFFCWFAP